MSIKPGVENSVDRRWSTPINDKRWCSTLFGTMMTTDTNPVHQRNWQSRTICIPFQTVGQHYVLDSSYNKMSVSHKLESCNNTCIPSSCPLPLPCTSIHSPLRGTPSLKPITSWLRSNPTYTPILLPRSTPLTQPTATLGAPHRHQLPSQLLKLRNGRRSI